MEYLQGDAVADLLDGLISRKHQRHHRETDLTAARVLRLKGGGAVDFGGSQEQPAQLEEVPVVKQAANDEYGWWDLQQGMYVVRYNERPALSDSQIAFVQPHERLLRGGVMHASYYFRGSREPLETTVMVGPHGVRIKQNARISKLLVLQL